MPKFNHMFTIAFEVKSDHNGPDVTGKELKKALQKRLDNLSETEMAEACGLPDETELEDSKEETFICPLCEEEKKVSCRVLKGCCRSCAASYDA